MDLQSIITITDVAEIILTPIYHVFYETDKAVRYRNKKNQKIK
jgi:hypothetical protein